VDAIRKTIRGERPLGETYWLWFFLPIVVLRAAGSMLVGLRPDVATASVPLVLLMAATCFVAFAFGWGVIQSARRHKPMSIWGWLASGVVVINWLLTAIPLVSLLVKI
jgi:hypothetical protein